MKFLPIIGYLGAGAIIFAIMLMTDKIQKVPPDNHNPIVKGLVLIVFMCCWPLYFGDAALRYLFFKGRS